MARLESVAIAGYFPTPPHLIAAVAALAAPVPGEHRDAVMDPCAGKGEALSDLLSAWYPPLDVGAPRRALHVYGIELEASRHKALQNLKYRQSLSAFVQIHHGDALRVGIETNTPGYKDRPGLSLLYLNPPYDHDRAPYKRLEERFLRRFLPALMPGGVLLFVVPVYALAASAETLGLWAEHVEVLRFPDPDYATFKQVVVRARRRVAVLPAPDPVVTETLRAAMDAPAALAPLGDPALVPYAFPVAPNTYDWRGQAEPGQAGINWKPRLLDEGALFDGHRAWHQTLRSGAVEPPHRIFPRTALGSLRARYPMAVPPKPAHIAAAIAAGVFNGETLTPDDRANTAPPIIVKGRFERAWRTVEEKRNQEGEATGVVQIEEPKLAVTALDLRALSFSQLKSSPYPSGSAVPASMTTGDLLTQYGGALLSTLRAHCPVIHDPADPAHVIPLVQTARPLYGAQAHAAMAVVKLLGGHRAKRRDRKGRFAFLIGEVGSGKSGTFLVVARSIHARRTLVVCPPHLLDSWRDEVTAVWPEARVVVLDSPRSLDLLAEEKHAGENTLQPVVAILSREAAKLGHGWASVPRCGECGRKAPAGDHAEKRSRCGAAIQAPETPDELVAHRVREVMVGHHPGLPGRPRCTPHHALRYVLEVMASAGMWEQVALVGETFASPEARLAVVARIPTGEANASKLLLTVHPDTPGWAVQALRHTGAEARAQGEAEETEEGAEPDEAVDPSVTGKEAKRKLKLLQAWSRYLHLGARSPDYWCPFGRVSVTGGVLSVEGRTVGTPDALGVVLAALPPVPTRRCEAPLFSAIPSPSRYPLATYLARRHPDLFDVVGLDEAHELSGEGSAQERAAHRITGTRVPTVLLTGSILNGYAAHLFPHLWALDPKFREAFKRGDRGKFAKQYGYRRRFVSSEREGKASKRGKVTDRVEGATRDMGEAPGIQPTAVLHWLLPHAVTLHKADLDVSIPPITITRVEVQPTDEMLTRHKAMLADLLHQIKLDRFSDKAGALWGQLTMAPSHLDRMTADVCGSPDGFYTVAYPDERGGEIVHQGETFPADTVLPKEQWMLDELKAELAEGRPTIVLSHHVELMPRYADLIRKHLGVKVAVLHAGKITPAKRQAWIKAQNAAGVQVLLTNPVAIGTGLNVLVYYATQLWMENPGCNAIVFRQAVGRIDRIGQLRLTRVKFPVYAGTIQEAAHRLLLQKVAVSQSTDGLDARSALQAAGVGEAPDVSALSVGKLLFELLDKSDGLRRALTTRRAADAPVARL